MPDIDADGNLILPWGWNEPVPWFGVIAGMLLTFWLVGRRGRSIDRPAGIVVAVASMWGPILAVVVAGVAAGTHPQRLKLRWRAGLAANTAVGFLAAGSAAVTASSGGIPVVELAMLAGVVWVGFALRHWRLGGRDPNRTFSASQRAEVMARDGGRCAYCGAHDGAPGVRLQMDHIDPWSQGGRTHVNNAQLLCQPCNGSKSDRSDSDARRRYRRRTGDRAGTW